MKNPQVYINTFGGFSLKKSDRKEVFHDFHTNHVSEMSFYKRLHFERGELILMQGAVKGV